jgi:hypothetical protein
MKTTISPAQAEAALDAIEAIKIKHVGSKAGYAIAKNTLALNKVVKAYHAFRSVTLAEHGVKPGERLDKDPEKAALITSIVAPIAQFPVETYLHNINLSELLAVWGDAPLTALTSIDMFIVDDLAIDAATPAT